MLLEKYKINTVLTFGHMNLFAKFDIKLMSTMIDNNCSYNYLDEIVIFALAKIWHI